MGDPCRRAHAVVSKTIGDVGEVERFAIEGDQRRPVSGQVFNRRDKGGLLLCYIAQQVLADDKLPVLDHPDHRKE